MSGSAYAGLASPGDMAGRFNADHFFIKSLLALIPGSTLVQVQSVTNTPGQVTKIGQVDVLPLVNQTDGALPSGNPTPHGTVHGLPYARMQGGKNAVILDPQQGDIGVAVFPRRDISSVKANNPAGNIGNAAANPGSGRTNNFADGVYLFTVLGPTPTQWIAFTPTGFSMTDINGNTLTSDADGWHINGALVNPSGDVITKHGTSLDHHVNTLVVTGSDESGPPP